MKKLSQMANDVQKFTKEKIFKKMPTEKVLQLSHEMRFTFLQR